MATGLTDDPGASPAAGRGGADGPSGRPPSGPIRAGRAAVIVVGAVVLGALLFPSATRGPQVTAKTTRPQTTTTTSHPTTPTTGHPGSTTSTSGPVTPSSVTVLAANAAGTAHSASEVDQFLQSKGYRTLAPANATTPTETASSVYVTAGTVAEAQAVAQALSLPAADVQTSGSPPANGTAGSDVVVIIGTDLAARADNHQLGTTTSST